MRIFIFTAILFSVFTQSNLFAQEGKKFRFVNAAELTVSGRAASVEINSFHRVDSAFLSKLPKRVAELSGNSAGISILFKTNSKNIKVKWTLGEYNTLWNMTPLAVNGMDLYGKEKDKWQYMASAKPLAITNETVLIEGLDGAMRYYRLYLPLYAELKTLEIGIDTSSIIGNADSGWPSKKKVVIYGSSITQGASASRPGMAYPSILERQLDIETYNMGFSGSGKMELILADVLASMKADVYVLDCVPNPSPVEIRERALPFIRRLRELKPGIPIIMVESIIREQANWSEKVNQRVSEQNSEFRKIFQQLIDEKYTGLYYIPAKELIGNDHEATIDGTHLTDLGFMRLADKVGKVLKTLIK